MKSSLSFLCIIFFLASCKDITLFKRIDSSHSSIHFSNTITQNDSINIIDRENIYNGGGVGIGDFNNDGLPDIYFTGNMVSNALYLNKGSLRFEDVTKVANVEGENKWSRGVSVVDINNDGWQDIYISCTMLADSTKRENILYINQGLNKNGIPVFKDMAREYGLADNSYTTQAAFFDYDNDGDLDVYMGVNVFARGDNPNVYRKLLTNGEHPNTDRLYRNDWDSVKGHPVFTNVSRQAGVLQEGYAHSVTICDINEDGWKDIFVANDYLSEDLLYINNGNGTFTNRSKEYFKHTAFNAMGADVVDINNDGLSDVVELDMNPEDNYRKKTMLGPGNYQSYLYNNEYNYQYQYIRNNLHLNMGVCTDKTYSQPHPIFSEISFYSGIAETDWSWTPLVADYDNDGFRDLMVTNGFPKDITDHDFIAFRNSAFALNDKKKLLAMIPEVKISNYAFHNNGNLKFSNVTKEWGMGLPSFSTGAAIADFDNDGDLDVVVNNINEEAFLYENKTNDEKETVPNWVQVKLDGSAQNRGGFGSWVKIFYKGQQQVYEVNPVRGYLSTNENIVSFGLGKVTKLDSLIVIWPDNKFQKLENVAVSRVITLKYADANDDFSWRQKSAIMDPIFKDVSDSLKLVYLHQQKDFNDFNIQRLLPHKFSQSGPPMAVGDINGDGLEDLVIGGGDGKGPIVFLQRSTGKFKKTALPGTKKFSSFDAAIKLFDADGDGDLDLYVAEGGYEEMPGSEAYQDRLYKNDGKGNFTLDTLALPINHSSKACITAVDFDKDGDIDLFIGSRVEPWKYPKPVSGILLRNDSKNGTIKFTDVTGLLAPGLHNIGLICDAVFSDYNNDGWPDLVLAGEWMPVTFFRNEKGKFVNETATSGIGDKKGWWNCIAACDLNGNGTIDFIVGNAGENSFFTNNLNGPVKNYFNDFDKNGTYESITTKMIKDKDGNYKEYPAASRDEVLDQLPFLKKRFLLYKDFGTASMKDLFTQKEMEGAMIFSANFFATSIFKNKGNGKFEIFPLPPLAQLSAVHGIIADDLDGDGKRDILICGNDYGAEVFNGRVDASNGLFLKGDGKGNFIPFSMQQSGIYIPGNAKAIVQLKQKNGNKLLIASQNNGLLKVYSINKK